MYEDSSWGSKIRKIHPFWGGIRIFRKIRTTGTPADAAATWWLFCRAHFSNLSLFTVLFGNTREEFQVTSLTCRGTRWPGGQVIRRAGDKVASLSGDKVTRCPGGQVVRWSAR